MYLIFHRNNWLLRTNGKHAETKYKDLMLHTTHNSFSANNNVPSYIIFGLGPRFRFFLGGVYGTT